MGTTGWCEDPTCVFVRVDRFSLGTMPIVEYPQERRQGGGKNRRKDRQGGGVGSPQSALGGKGSGLSNRGRVASFARWGSQGESREEDGVNQIRGEKEYRHREAHLGMLKVGQNPQGKKNVLDLPKGTRLSKGKNQIDCRKRLPKAGKD